MSTVDHPAQFATPREPSRRGFPAVTPLGSQRAGVAAQAPFCPPAPAPPPGGFPFRTGGTIGGRGSGVITATPLLIADAFAGLGTYHFNLQGGPAETILTFYTFQPICMFGAPVSPSPAYPKAWD